ncbi:MAG: pitrilysin family protein [Pseudomonadota bacterium]
MFAKRFTVAVLFLASVCASVAQAALPIQHWQTPQGVRVYFLQTHSLPMVDILVNFDAGSVRDDKTHGLASLTASLLDQGIQHAPGNGSPKDAQAIAEGFENIGASMGASASVDSATLSLRSLSDGERFESALKLFTSVMSHPSFPQDAFKRERERALLGLKAEQQQPDEVAQRAFFKALYGDHPYAWPANGDIDSVQALTLDQVRAFHTAHYVTAGMSVVMVGDLSRAQAEATAERLAASLPKGEAMPAIPAPQALKEAQAVHLPFPSAQASILVGQLGMSRDDPDYFPLYVGNHILGGSGFSSILMEEIREKRGLAYGVYSYLLPMQQPGPFLMGVQTKLDQGQQAESLMHANLLDFIKNGPSAKQLEHAKNNIIGGFPLRLDSNKDIAGWLSIMAIYQLPLDFLEQYPKHVATVTADSIRKAWQARIHPERMVSVTVGGAGEQPKAPATASPQASPGTP